MAKDRETKSTRDKAAAARAEQVAKEKRRERTVRIVGAVGVIVAVLAIIGVAVFASRSGDSSANGGTPMPAPDPNAAIPTGVYGADGVIVGSAFIKLILDAPGIEEAEAAVAALARELAAGVRRRRIDAGPVT